MRPNVGLNKQRLVHMSTELSVALISELRRRARFSLNAFTAINTAVIKQRSEEVI